MDACVSVSFFQDELASTIEHAVKAAVDTVLREITKVVGSKFTELQVEMAGKEKENEILRLRLEISESELNAVRECMNAADADIKQPLIFQGSKCSGVVVWEKYGGELLCLTPDVTRARRGELWVCFEMNGSRGRTVRNDSLPNDFTGPEKHGTKPQSQGFI